MRSLGIALAACWLGACAAGAAVTVAPGRTVDPTRFQRLGVLPFTEGRGAGRILAVKIAAGLAHADYNCVDLEQLDSVFSSLGLDYAQEISQRSLAEVRRATLVDGLVSGSVDSDWKAASVILADAATGEVVLRAVVRPAEERFRSTDEIADAVAKIFASHPAQAAAAEGNPLPDPQ